MTIRIARLIASTAAIALSAPALAQDGEAAEDIVVTAQRDNQTQVERGGSVGALGDKAADDVPFAIKSYSETLILNQQPQTLGQVLENDPSVRLSYGFGNAAELFIIRGFPLLGDDIAIDGLYGVTPRQLIAPELYDSVQVLNGASAFLNGAAPGGSGIGGSVNLQLKRAEEPLTRLTANFAESGHVGGAFDVARRFGGDGALGVRVNGAYRAGDVSVEDEFRRTAVIGAGIDWRSERVRLSADIAYQRVEVRGLRPKVAVTSAIPAPPEASANYAQPWTFTELRDVFGVVRGEYDLSDNAMVYASFGARDGSEEGLYSGVAVNDVTTGSALFVPRTDNNEAALAGLRVKLAGGAVSHEINFGGSLVRQVNRNAFDFGAQFATNLYDTPVVPPPGAGFIGGDLNDPFAVGRVRLGSAFASDTIGILDDRVLLTAGLRLQAINVKGYAYNDDIALGIAAGDLTAEYRESAASPVVGLVVKPVDGLSLYANRIEGLAQGATAPIDPLLVNSGEVFAPFSSVQVEVGGKLTLGRFNMSLAAFQTEQPSSFTRPVDPGDPDGPRIFVVEGEQRNRGLELSLDGEPVRGLRVIGGASITEAILTNTGGSANEGNTAVGVPDYTINANAEWDLPFAPGFTLTARVVNTGAQFVDAANTLEIPGWTRVDLGARYVLAVAERPLTLRLTIDNVADNAYWQSAYDSFSPSLLQGAPRTVKLSASIDL